MIPDFKTFLKESIWSDIEDRSLGDQVRKEDDINNFDIEQFCDYLKGIYKYENENDIRIKNDDLIVTVFRDENRILYYHLEIVDYNKESTYVGFNFMPVLGKELVDGLKERYDVSIVTGNSFMIIKPTDGIYKNTFFVDLIDFVLDNVPIQFIETIKRK